MDIPVLAGRLLELMSLPVLQIRHNSPHCIWLLQL
jgi:hypothetical protein